MNGPKHYELAEKLLAEAVLANADSTTIDIIKLSAAQTHAHLAQTAAMVSPESFADLKVQWRKEAGYRL